MHRRHNTLSPSLALILALFACASAMAETAEKGLPSDVPATHEVPLPESLRAYLGEELPTFRPVTQKDYWAGWFNAKHKEVRDALRWSVKADFDGNGMDDYALLMVGTKDGKRHVSLVAARAGEHGWTHEVLNSYA